MIPPLNEHGYLPPGVHPATIGEVVARFGAGSEQREAIAHSLLWLLPQCRDAGVTKVLIDGSFVTDRADPNDADCALLATSNYDESSPAAERLLEGLPFIDQRVVNDEDYAFYASTMFGLDRRWIPKAVLEVLV